MTSSTASSEEPREPWHAPQSFREGLADAERVADLLVAQLTVEPSLLISVERIEFLARRVHQLTRSAHEALPPEVI